MPTILVDDEDSSQSCWQPIPGFVPTPIRERIGEPIPPEGECCLFNGEPCILFADWDLGQRWGSGEYVVDIHPFALLSAPQITVEEFWQRVREWQEHLARSAGESPVAENPHAG